MLIKNPYRNPCNYSFIDRLLFYTLQRATGFNFVKIQIKFLILDASEPVIPVK